MGNLSFPCTTSFQVEYIAVYAYMHVVNHLRVYIYIYIYMYRPIHFHGIRLRFRVTTYNYTFP